MLIKLTPEQVSMYWPAIEEGIKKSLSTRTMWTQQGVKNMLIGLMTGQIDCRFLISSDIIYGFVITRVIEDPITGDKNLLIYSLYSSNRIPQEIWLEGAKELREDAYARGCTKVVAYSSEPRVLEMAKKLGFKDTTRYLEYEV